MTLDDATAVFTSATTATLLCYQEAGRTLVAEVRTLRQRHADARTVMDAAVQLLRQVPMSYNDRTYEALRRLETVLEQP